VGQPGWQEARKLGGRPYAVVTAGLAYQDEIESLRMSALQDRANTVYALDVLIAALRGLRDDIENGDEESLAGRLEQALEGRSQWMQDRLRADWQLGDESKPIQLPSMSERFFGNMLFKPPQKKK
jgi:hypothetical protein